MGSSPSLTPPLSEPLLEAIVDLWSQAGPEHDVCVRGNSMWPLIRAGDRVRVMHGLSGLRWGDIVAYQREDRLIVHRLIRIVRREGELFFQTQGDNASSRDPAVSAGRVLGRVVALRRAGSWLRLDTRLMRGIGWVLAALGLGRLALSRLLE